MVKNNLNKKIPQSLLYILIFLTVLNLAVIAISEEADHSVVFSDIFNYLLNLVTAITLWSAARFSRSLSEKTAKGWAILALAQFFFSIGDLLWGIHEVIFQSNPYPSIADVFYLAYYPIFLVGSFFLRSKGESKIRKFNNMLDAGIIFLVAGLFLGVYIFPPILDSTMSETMPIRFLSLAYPVGDLILLSALLILIYNQQEDKFESPIIFIVISLVIQIVTDIIFSYQSLEDAYSSADWLDIGWILGYLLLGIAGYLQCRAVTTTVEKKENPEPRIVQGKQIQRTIRSNLPFLSIIIGYILFFEIMAKSNVAHVRHTVGGFGILILLVVIRQFLTLWENNQLNSNLKNTLVLIKSQAADLQKINDDLQIEISERKKAEDQLAFDALHDSLTKLPNRILLADRLQHAIEYSKRHKDYDFSVFFVDIDHFKNVNDSMGHSIGDKLLVHFSERILKCLRKSDTLARLGGDEFAILLENHSSLAESKMIAERIQEVLRPPYNLAGKDFYVSASIGIVIDTENYKDSESILQDADIAMYRAKSLGKARYEIFTTNLRIETLSQLELENQLFHAIENHELILNYQPIYSLQTKALIGFEALLRWNHPSRGKMMPTDFLAIAEKSDLIVKISEWVIQEACMQLKKWKKNYPGKNDLVININVSGRHFVHTSFIPYIEKTLKRTGLDPRCICLEITETVLVQNQEQARIVFNTLHDMGFDIQIDDFGTGYSSMGYLLNFHVDTIKIDKSFIQAIGKEKNGHHLVKTIVEMAQSLGIEIIAEGIETDQQLQDLRSMACKYGQGYFLSYPLASSEIEQLIENVK